MATMEFAIRKFGELAEKHELPWGWDFKFDRASRRYGQCDHTNQTISVSRVLLPGCSNDSVEQTLIHEMAHALVGPHNGHNNIWLRKARSMGYRGGRCGSGSAEVKKIQESLKNVHAHCPTCNKVVHKQQRMPRNLHLKQFRHPSCGSVVNWLRVGV